MATASSLLAKIEARIEAMLDVPFDGETGEYEYGGRRWKQIDFSKQLDSLMAQREKLRAEVSRASRSSVRVGGLRRPG